MEMDEDDPIKEEKTLFEKFRESFLGNRKKKVYITTRNPYANKEYDHLIGYYKAKDEKQLVESMQNLGDAFRKFGITAEEAKERIVHFSKILPPEEMRRLMERRMNGRT